MVPLPATSRFPVLRMSMRPLLPLAPTINPELVRLGVLIVRFPVDDTVPVLAMLKPLAPNVIWPPEELLKLRVPLTVTPFVTFKLVLKGMVPVTLAGTTICENCPPLSPAAGALFALMVNVPPVASPVALTVNVWAPPPATCSAATFSAAVMLLAEVKDFCAPPAIIEMAETPDGLNDCCVVSVVALFGAVGAAPLIEIPVLVAMPFSEPLLAEVVAALAATKAEVVTPDAVVVLEERLSADGRFNNNDVPLPDMLMFEPPYIE